MLQLKAKTSARRIAPKDTGLGSSFPGARGFFLADNDALDWETLRLQAFTALGYSISNAHYLLYLPENGRPVVEENFTLDNQGSPEIPIHVPGDATYLAINDQPHVLSKDKEGNLLLQLDSGSNRVQIQYQPPQTKGGIAALFHEALAKPAAVQSNVTVNLALAPKWEVFLAKGLNEVTSDFSSAEFAAGAILTLGLLFFFLVRVLKWPRRKALGVLVAYGLACFFKPFLLWLVWLAALVLLVLRFWQRWLEAFRRHPIRNALAAAVVGFVALIVFVNFTTRVGRVMTNSMSKIAQNVDQSYETDGAFAPPASVPGGEGARPMLRRGGGAKEKDVRGTEREEPEEAQNPGPKGEIGGTDDNYQGLPAKLTIPGNVRYLGFSQGMIDIRSPVRTWGLLLSRSITAWLTLLLLLGACIPLWRSREALLAWALRK
jgi:hypothetical protein